ncbi:hypothetical protein [Bradyrhizobium sp. URHA0013]|uniref:hypothetical protein n=1 Tax=Bradyrhizobium sp. URHA0013 TaxID=1380352 RepID=UPI000485CC7F|nr:hypothetical protein [Bradyrhizobium sp. URHA0013]
MRRDQLIGATENLANALESSKIHQVLLSAIRSSKDPISPNQLFSAYASFMTAYANFGPTEKYLMKLFKVERLIVPEFWEGLIKQDGSPSSMTVRRGITLVTEFLPSVARMLERPSDKSNLAFENPVDPSKTVDSEKIRFFVRDPGVPTLTVGHFSSILGAIEELHSAIETVEQTKHSDLVVASLDSGSDKEFDLLGVAAAVRKLSETLLEVWSRIQSARATKAKVNYGAACEGIAVLVKLNAAEKSNAIPKDQAESIRRTIISSITHLFENGVYTEAMEAQVNPLPSALPVDRRKLLTHQPSESAPLEAPDEGSASNEEI